MKKLIAAVLATFSLAAAAQVTGTVSYEYGNVAGVKNASVQEVVTTIAVPTALGVFDAGIIGNRARASGVQDDTLGFELAYSNSVKLTHGTLMGRAAVGRLNQVDPSGSGFAGNLQFFTLTGEFSAPVAPRLGAFVAYRHLNTFDSVGDTAQNRVAAGVDFAAMKNLSVRTGVFHSRELGGAVNGLQVALTYGF
jgi:hypothetical protein